MGSNIVFLKWVKRKHEEFFQDNGCCCLLRAAVGGDVKCSPK